MADLARWCCGFLTISALATGSASGGTDAPALSIDWSVNGGPVNHLFPGGTPAGGGAFVYAGISTDPDTGLDLSYSLNGNPVTGLSGNVHLFNELSTTIAVSVDVSLPFDPDFPSGTLLSGFVVVGLTNGIGGGMISSVPPAVFHTIIDGENAGFFTTLFWDPFLMASTGQGNLSTYSDYGIPNLVPGPPLLYNLGYSLDFRLTSLDLGSISINLTVDGDAVFRAADLDGDSIVGAGDFHLLVQDWGDCGNPQDCPADLDHDGTIGIGDLLIMVEAWGEC